MSVVDLSWVDFDLFRCGCTVSCSSPNSSLHFLTCYACWTAFALIAPSMSPKWNTTKTWPFHLLYGTLTCHHFNETFSTLELCVSYDWRDKRWQEKRITIAFLSTTPDIEQYKLLSVNEDPLDHFLDVLCFPVLFPSGRFREFYPCSVNLF